MHKELPFGGETDGLRVHLRKTLNGQNSGDLPDSATVAQVAAALAAEPDGSEGTPQAVCDAERWLRALHKDGFLPFRNTEHPAKAQGRPFLGITTIKTGGFLGGQSPQETAEAQRSRTSAAMKGDIPDKPHSLQAPTTTATTQTIGFDDLAKLAPTIKLSVYKSGLISLLIGVDTPSKQQTPAPSADDDLPADVRGKTAVPLPAAARLLGQYVEGGEDYVKLRHKHKGREPKYSEVKAFNDDIGSTVNCPVFYRVAKAAGFIRAPIAPGHLWTVTNGN